MQKINCVDDSFWDKPFYIDFKDQKFGYCVLAVFNKKKEFQRTYMIAPSVRKKTLYPARRTLFNTNLDEINAKVYTMCEEACPSFDSYDAVMRYYNKTMDMWKTKKVYAAYINFLGGCKGPINHWEQIIGEQEDLTAEELGWIVRDVSERYKVCDLDFYNMDRFVPAGYKLNFYRAPDSVNRMMQRTFFMANKNGTPNYIHRKNCQALCIACGLHVPCYETPLVYLLQRMRTTFAYRLGASHDNCKGYALTLMTNDFILNAKCIYQCIMQRMCGENPFQAVVKNALNSYFEGPHVKIAFKNLDYLLQTLQTSIRCYAILEAGTRYFSLSGSKIFTSSVQNKYSTNLYSYGVNKAIVVESEFATDLKHIYLMSISEIQERLGRFVEDDACHNYFQFIPEIIYDTHTSYETNFYNYMFMNTNFPAYDEANVYGMQFMTSEDDTLKIHRIETMKG